MMGMKFEPNSVPVYLINGKVVVMVSNRVTSIGAAKAAKVRAVEWTLRFGKAGWLIKP